MLARALATRRFIAQSAFPIGTVIAGWAAAVIEPWIVVTLSGALLAAGTAAQLASPGDHTLEARRCARRRARRGALRGLDSTSAFAVRFTR